MEWSFNLKNVSAAAVNLPSLLLEGRCFPLVIFIWRENLSRRWEIAVLEELGFARRGTWASHDGTGTVTGTVILELPPICRPAK